MGNRNFGTLYLEDGSKFWLVTCDLSLDGMSGRVVLASPNGRPPDSAIAEVGWFTTEPDRHFLLELNDDRWIRLSLATSSINGTYEVSQGASLVEAPAWAKFGEA